MPTAAIDLFFASSIMILVVIGAIYGMNLVVEPYLGGDGAHLDRYQQIGRYMLLSRGEPWDWGAGGAPTVLGFASTGGAYGLDIDKVTRLNPSNAYALNYSQLWSALGIDDVSFRIRVDTLFNLTLSLVSSTPVEKNINYTFSASTMRHGYPISAEVYYYIVIKDKTFSKTGTTVINGSGTVEFTLPENPKGTALLVAFARIEQSIVSYSVLPFAHNSESPNPAGSWAILSPLNYTLHVNLTEGANVKRCFVVSLTYLFQLEGGDGSYVIPRLLDASPMVLVLTGEDDRIAWAEWVAYPQVPLVVGSDMSDAYTVSDTDIVSYLAEIRGALYRFDVKFRSRVQDE